MLRATIDRLRTPPAVLACIGVVVAAFGVVLFLLGLDAVVTAADRAAEPATDGPRLLVIGFVATLAGSSTLAIAALVPWSSDQPSPGKIG